MQIEEYHSPHTFRRSEDTKTIICGPRLVFLHSTDCEPTQSCQDSNLLPLLTKQSHEVNLFSSQSRITSEWMLWEVEWTCWEWKIQFSSLAVFNDFNRPRGNPSSYSAAFSKSLDLNWFFFFFKQLTFLNASKRSESWKNNFYIGIGGSYMAQRDEDIQKRILEKYQTHLSTVGRTAFTTEKWP